ncbi:GatB/YqeY domain-containing protein [Dichomitus squalens]|uniref:Altered inheritance of mitochondria protein 41 n=1 Tax=Dichomitus squalens TaxID=114155 RepID=A0A4Q9M9W7_9APHY|nr:GatB/YqeY domain-containing protein [Dichomitus squalens]
MDGLVQLVEDVRARLLKELKDAMKTKNTVKSITIRSVLSEVYAADKAASGTASPSTVAGILRKATVRRMDAASEFQKASRSDLAAKEQQEAAILEAFLPPLLPEAEIERILKEVLATHEVSKITSKGPPQKILGQVFKAFYGQVDKSSVDADLVRKHAQALLASSS